MNLIVESNWKDKHSTFTLASSLNLDDLKREFEHDLCRPNNQQARQTEKTEFFQPIDEDEEDKQFDLQVNPPVYTKPLPNFV